MVLNQSCKIDKIFQIIDGLNVYEHYAFKTIVFSDSILVFNDEWNASNHYYVTYLIEFTQQLFYKLLSIGVYFKGLITYGEFNFKQMNNIQAYWGKALIETYNDANDLKGLGLFVNKKLSSDIVVFDKLDNVDSKYDFIFLCQSFISLYKSTRGKLPIELMTLYETDKYMNIDDDIKFFREIQYIKDNYRNQKIVDKYLMVYMWYKKYTYPLFRQLEDGKFSPSVLNSNYFGRMSPFDIKAKVERKDNDVQL